MPQRIVIDPNVFISALMAKPGSPNLGIAQAVTANKLTFVSCPCLLQELAEVARRPRFRRWFGLEDAERLVDALARRRDAPGSAERPASLCRPRR